MWLYLYLPKHRQQESDFACVNNLDWGFNVATKIIVKIFFNNKQTFKDIVRKETVTGFNKHQRTK